MLKAKANGDRLNELFVQWYEQVERLIQVYLKAVGIIINKRRHPMNGAHRYHEEILESLRNPNNPYHDVLGRGRAHDHLKEAKRVRNSIRGKGPRSKNVTFLDWNRMTEFINVLKEYCGYLPVSQSPNESMGRQPT